MNEANLYISNTDFVIGDTLILSSTKFFIALKECNLGGPSKILVFDFDGMLLEKLYYTDKIIKSIDQYAYVQRK